MKLLEPLKVAPLSRCMQQRLSSLHAEVTGARSGHMPQRCEQVIAMSALACFTAHLTAGAQSLGRYYTFIMTYTLSHRLASIALGW